MNSETIKILILEPSVILRNGLSMALKRTPKAKIIAVENTALSALPNHFSLYRPDILIVNPVYWGFVDLAKLREDYDLPKLRCLALLGAPVEDSILKQYDDSISIFDASEQIDAKIARILKSFASEGEAQEAGVLSTREKEIVSCVVKGMTNKEIATALFLSTHTVITHRRNISRKLEIHSTAGLTVYAIANKLIEIEDLNKK